MERENSRKINLVTGCKKQKRIGRVLIINEDGARKNKISTPKIAKQGWGRGLRSGQSKYQKEKRRKKEKLKLSRVLDIISNIVILS